jgi:hypothetical protein
VPVEEQISVLSMSVYVCVVLVNCWIIQGENVINTDCTGWKMKYHSNMQMSAIILKNELEL